MKQSANEKLEQMEADRSRIDWMITLVPFALIMVLALLFYKFFLHNVFVLNVVV